jgi:ABC-type cobalt transport system substrate-binding protein
LIPIDFKDVRKFIDNYLYLVVLFLLCILLITLSLLSEGYYGGADNIAHYTLSHFSFKYPHLFLDLWGRPLFTILSSPFSQFGFHGIKIFNILTGLLASYISYLIAIKLKLEPPVLVIIIVCFTPLYCIMLLTGLTETLFSLVLVLAIYYFFDEKYILAAIVISFLMFARTEGFIILPIFCLAFITKRKFQAIPFLITGFIFFSFIGSFYYKDFLWIIHNFPYSASNPAFYKSGSFFHFLIIHRLIMGKVIEMLLIIGLLSLCSRFFIRDRTQRIAAFYELLLIFGPFAVYIAFHSFLFWKGLGGSLGLERVLAGVLPLGAILGMRGYHLVNKFLPGTWMKSIFLIACTVQMIRVNFITYHYPVELGREEQLEKQASLWFAKSGFTKRNIYYTDCNACFFVDTQPDVDLFNPTGLHRIWFYNDTKSLPPGSILQWDAHFGANESKTPRDSLMMNPHLKLLNSIRPDEPMWTLGGYPYEILFFLVLPDNEKSDNYALMESIAAGKEKAYQHKFLLFHDFEPSDNGIDLSKTARDTAYSGSGSFRMDKKTEYSPSLETTCSAISSLKENILIRPRVFVLFPAPLLSGKVFFVISLEEKNRPYQYEAIELNDFKIEPGQWTKISFTVHLQKIRSPDDIVKVYLWNFGKSEFYLDNFSVEALIPVAADK